MVADDGGLFGSLPEQPAPAGAEGALPRLRRADRCQLELRPVSTAADAACQRCEAANDPVVLAAAGS